MDAHKATPVIRPAEERDTATIFRLVRALAEYEKLLPAVVATERDFRDALFPSAPGVRPVAEALLAFAGETAVGFALYFTTFSTFLGRPGIYLDDIFVEPEYRGQGFGSALLKRIARIAVERRCGRVEWSVLTWNQPSIDFYLRMGAVAMDEWQTFRLTGSALDRLGA